MILSLYFSIEPVVRAQRIAAENEIEPCDDRADCCAGTVCFSTLLGSTNW